MEVKEADIVLCSCCTVSGLQMLSRKCAVMSVVGTNARRHPNGIKQGRGIFFSVITSCLWPSTSLDSFHWLLLLAGGLLLNCLKTMDKLAPSDCSPLPAAFSELESSNLGEAELFIRDQRLALGKHHKAALGCKGALWAYCFLSKPPLDRESKYGEAGKQTSGCPRGSAWESAS